MIVDQSNVANLSMMIVDQLNIATLSMIMIVDQSNVAHQCMIVDQSNVAHPPCMMIIVKDSSPKYGNDS